MSILLSNDTPVLPVSAPRSWDRPAQPRRSAVAPARLVPHPRASADDETPSVSQRPVAPSLRRARTALLEILLTVAAVLGVAATGLTVAAATSGYEPLVVRSGSMEPGIPTGGMVLVRTVPAAELGVGDVVTVHLPTGTRVTHRIVSLEHRGPTAVLTLQGDANDDPDRDRVTVTEAGRYVWSVPLAGRTVTFLASAKGGFVLGCLIGGVAVPVLRRRGT